MVEADRIELSSSVLQTVVSTSFTKPPNGASREICALLCSLQVSYVAIYALEAKCLLWMDLNHRPMHYRAFTVSCTIIACTDLPTELHNKLESVGGIEPPYCSFAESRLTTWPYGHKLVRNVGVEPTTEPWQSPVLPLN